MRGVFIWTLLLVAGLALMSQAQMTEDEMNTMSENILGALDRQMETIDEDDAGRSLKGVKKAVEKIGQKVGTLIKKIWTKIPKDKIKKAVKSTLTEVKDSLKEKGKKFIIKEGKKQAKSFLKHEVLKFIKKKVLNEVCECRTDKQCGCCVKPPGLEKGCFNMTAIPDEQKFRIKATYGGEQLIGRKISGDKEMMSCKHLPSPLDIVEICVLSQGIQQIDEHNFRSCFRMVSHGLEVAKCIIFQDGKASLY